MSRPCPWCDRPLAETMDGSVGWVWSPSAQTHMWYCQFGLPAPPMQAAAASASAVSALPVSAPVDRSGQAGRGGLTLWRLLSALPGRGSSRRPSVPEPPERLSGREAPGPSTRHAATQGHVGEGLALRGGAAVRGPSVPVSSSERGGTGASTTGGV